ncbi:MAG: hypothetical protein LBN23_08725 [Paludibacter sp.]|nr:hypothetical protein [Paludibacter sp.]
MNSNTLILDSPSFANLNLIAELAKKLNINVLSISKKEREEIEDLKLLQVMRNARLEGFADTNTVLSKLGIA